MRVLGITCARGGSKRLPRKNVRLLHGKPLILWTVETAIQCDLLHDYVVSTDDPEIKRIVEPHAVVIDRPPELAQDDSEVIGAIEHALKEFPAPAVCLLQPTSPLRSVTDVTRGLTLFLRSGAPCVYSTDTLNCFEGTQGRPNGAFYVAETEWLLRNRSFEAQGCTNYHIPNERGIDIDTLEDFERAESLLVL